MTTRPATRSQRLAARITAFFQRLSDRAAARREPPGRDRSFTISCSPGRPCRIIPGDFQAWSAAQAAGPGRQTAPSGDREIEAG